MGFSSHIIINFVSRYARKPIKGSKDLNHSLVSKKNFSQKTARWVGAQRQVNLAKKAKTWPHYDVTHRKPQTQNDKKTFPNP